MNVYKLQYASKESLESALLSRGVLVDSEEYGLQYGEGTHAVVHLGNIVVTNAVLDENGDEVSPAVLSDKYHADIMVEGSFDFGSNDEGDPSNPVHQFKTA